ncbi:hypothetical protein BAE44_0002034 [Dichanthelium oligosanthes]|uniref:Uncharacterized protein n=1 Tax=Dichanthelium oligosanthes TaxID=888268 RepID=A0A1E5WHS2_9POAL|nr:hypothetical protein BAE44_0002034 [Dichanthelium oligosanthes]
MQSNRITGTIPIGFGKLPSLQRLELAGNDLSGEIPGDLASSTSLSFIDVSHNHLHSKTAQHWQRWTCPTTGLLA